MKQVTREEKLQYAKMLRNPNNLAFQPENGYLDVIKEVATEEFTITAADGYEIPVWLITPPVQAKEPLLYINIHGGGFVSGHSIFDSALCAVTAKELGAIVLDVDYRLAPECPFPTGMNDCYDVLQWAYDHVDKLGVNPDRIVVGGNSAGGTYAADVCMLSQARGTKMPAMMVMIYPACDISPMPEEIPDDLDLTQLQNRGLLYNLCYLESAEEADDPFCSIVRAGAELLTEMPDTVLVTAGKDPLCANGEEFGKHLMASGSHIAMQRFRKSGHGFYVRCIGPEWEKARKFVFDEIRRKMGI